MNREAFVRSMLVLGEIYGEPVSDLRLEGYLDALNDLPGEDVLDALRASPRTCKFFPRPADIRELAVARITERRREERQRDQERRYRGEITTAEGEVQLVDFWRRVGEIVQRRALPDPVAEVETFAKEVAARALVKTILRDMTPDEVETRKQHLRDQAETVENETAN